MAAVNGLLTLDPRTKILLLLGVNIFVFTNPYPGAEMAVIAGLSLLLLLCGIPRTALRTACTYAAMLVIQVLVLPHSPRILMNSLNILVITCRKLLPCVALGALLVQTTPIRLLIHALEIWHLPRSVIIPLAITVRYFPTLRQEYQAISDAMKLRHVRSPLKKLEFIAVPLILSASSTADELSQAITARGIDNPGAKSCYTELKLQAADYLLCAVALCLIPLAWILR